MRRTIHLLHIIIVGRMLILVPDNKPDGCSRCLSFVNTGKELHFIIFLSWSRNPGLSGFSSVQFSLNCFHIQFKARRTAINHTSNTRAMRLAKRSKSEYISKCIHKTRTCMIDLFNDNLRNHSYLHDHGHHNHHRSYRNRSHSLRPEQSSQRFLQL